MIKYFKISVAIMYSIIRFSLIKIFHWNTFNFPLINLVSPMTDIEIGEKSKLSFGKLVKIKSGCKVRVRHHAEIAIGNNTFMNHDCMIISHEKINIGSGVQIGPNVLIYDHDHDFRVPGGISSLKYKTSSVNIGDNVWIGANTIILKGTKIGEGSVIGAGSVIKGEFPANSFIVQQRETRVNPIN
ncbi:acyltransferase [Planococcus soli]|uniref:acyltransferase n=1 Tax=Planococcus soli TaxID=2666072 RepID=UPI00115F2669|nr:acyltransferase [Planococcus soli]